MSKPHRFPRRVPTRDAVLAGSLRPAERRPDRRALRLLGVLTLAFVFALPPAGFSAVNSGGGPAMPSDETRSQTHLPDVLDSKQEPTPRPELNPESPALTKKQKQDLLKSNFEKLKHDADELSVLAKSLQQDLDKSNENVLSLKILDRAEKIEKLARKIRSEAKGD